MNLTKEDIAELNDILSDNRINLPEYRRVVNNTGGNYKWLQHNFKKFNSQFLEDNPRLKQLLKL